MITRKRLLLSSCGSDTFKLLKSLTAPNDLASSSYTDIKQLMSEHKTQSQMSLLNDINLTVEIEQITNQFLIIWQS